MVTVAHLCVIVAAILPIVCAGIAKSGYIGKPRSQGGYDNHDPRAWLAQQTGYRARANAAQANSFEALPFFIGAVLIAQMTQARQPVIDGLALLFIASRVAYIAIYLADRDMLRSALWGVGFFTCIALVFASKF